MDKTLGRCGWNYQIIWLHHSASTWPRWFADSKNSFSFPGLDPPKTQIFLMWWLEEPAISTHFYICWMCELSRNEGREGREDFIDEKLKMQSYHLHVGQLESLSLFFLKKTYVCTSSCDCGSHFPLVLHPRTV